MDSPRATATPPTAMEVLIVKLIEAPYHAPPPQLHHDSSSRPTIGFPLGTALLLIVVFTLSGIFSCCYHWDKLRHLRGDFSDDDSDHSPAKPKPDFLEKKGEEDRSLPVIMAGDRFPRFIAMPCTCGPPSDGKMTGPPHVVIPIK